MKNYINLQRDTYLYDNAEELPVFKHLHNNSIMAINPYNDKGQWMFDDDATGLKRELFVGGADTLLDEIQQRLNFSTIIFSATDFPGATVILHLRKTEDEGKGGSTYYCPMFNHDVWLCPAMLLYFKTPPAKIYIQAK